MTSPKPTPQPVDTLPCPTWCEAHDLAVTPDGRRVSIEHAHSFPALYPLDPPDEFEPLAVDAIRGYVVTLTPGTVPTMTVRDRVWLSWGDPPAELTAQGARELAHAIEQHPAPLDADPDAAPPTLDDPAAYAGLSLFWRIALADQLRRAAHLLDEDPHP